MRLPFVHQRTTIFIVAIMRNSYLTYHTELPYRSMGRSRYLVKYAGKFFFMYILHNLSSFGGIGVACWPLVPKFAGSNLAEAVGFLRAKKSSARLPSEGK